MTLPSQPNLTSGILGAVVGALLGAAAWATLTVVTNFKIGYAAVGVGALTGFLAGRMGGGAPQLPPIAAGIGLLGCVFGDVLTDAHAVADASGASLWRVVKLMLQHPSDVGWPIYKAGFGFLDVVFYGFAAYAAFQLATQHGLLHRQAAAPPPAPVWQPPTTPPAGGGDDTPPPTISYEKPSS
jgi:hypothetical protein